MAVVGPSHRRPSSIASSSSSSSVDLLKAFDEDLVPSRPPTAPESEVTLSYAYTADRSIDVKLAVDAGPGCGGIAWPAGEVLSRYLCWKHAQDATYLKGKKVIELGSGTGLVGLVAGLLEQQVECWITDIP